MATSDTQKEIDSRLASRRERLNRLKQGASTGVSSEASSTAVGGLTNSNSSTQQALGLVRNDTLVSSSTADVATSQNLTNASSNTIPNQASTSLNSSSALTGTSSSLHSSTNVIANQGASSSSGVNERPSLEQRISKILLDVSTRIPCGINHISNKLERIPSKATIESTLRQLEKQDLVELSGNSSEDVTVVKVNTAKMYSQFPSFAKEKDLVRVDPTGDSRKRMESSQSRPSQRPKREDSMLDLSAILSAQSHRESEMKKVTDEIAQFLNAETAMDRSIARKFQSQNGSSVREYCTHLTRQACHQARKSKTPCNKLHFRKIIKPHTDLRLGNCSYLNNCFNMDSCRFVHYEIEVDSSRKSRPSHDKDMIVHDVITTAYEKADMRTYPPQWIQCDLRYINFDCLGKFSVIMADPPWDIHMELPYGTLEDKEMISLPIQKLQDDGFIFLWVTGRATEVGRECLMAWGYELVDELIWVKTNQLQQLIRTGRTGHWLNHGKEHCLVGRKGNPVGITRGLDCDVVVAEVREMSQKPDEIYGIIERISPGTRKIELFGRPHNVQPNWTTLGNQLEGVRLEDPDFVESFQKFYPDDVQTTIKYLVTGKRD